MRKFIFIVVGLVGLVLLGKMCYQVLMISSTIPHIKDYQYRGQLDSFDAGLRAFIKRHPDVTFKVNDIVGDDNSGRVYYADLSLAKKNDSILYNIRYDADETGIVKIGLVGAHNLKNKTGGYGKSADGMNALINNFTLEIIKPLYTETGINLTAVE